MQTKIERIQNLVKELNTYRNEYYNLNKPSISDLEYDTKFDELSKLEKEHDYILSDSPTQSVGYEVKSKLNKRQHPTPLKSLDKTKSIDELNKWKNGKDTILMIKADGLTVELDYENGQFINGYTRGNGEIGEEIGHNCRVFKNIPLTIPFKGKLRVSGEAIIHWNDFNNINSKLTDDEKYATPRNLVSGSVRQLDSKICSQRNVYFYAFNILECEDMLYDSKFERFNGLYRLGFTVIPTINLWNNSITENNINELKNQANKLGIPIDGLVASYDSVKYSNSLPITSHHPLHSLAFKFYDETEETILRDVEWNTTRSGQINPTAIFDTVIIDGTEVSRASLHNLSIIEGLQLDIGNHILVSKRNLIIPHVEDNLDRDENILSYPSVCPSCGGKTKIRNTGTADFLFCTNDDCSAKLLNKFVNFVKRDAMNIEGLSEATLEKFINKGWLQKFDDIYYLDEHKSEIVRMEGFGLKSYNNLIESIEKSKNVKLENFLTALGIEGVGLSTAKLLTKKFKTIDNLLGASRAEFMNIDGIGEITANSIYEYRLLHIGTIQCLRDKVNIIEEEKKEIISSDSPFAGKKIYGTGTFANYKKEELKTLLESLGAEFANGYAKSLDYLIVGSLKGSSKEDKAKKDGISILTEDKFIKMLK
jgi:DNA ligase (NAD+)